MKRVYATIKIRVVVDMEDDIEEVDFLNELDYNINSTTKGAVILDTEFFDYDIEVNNE